MNLPIALDSLKGIDKSNLTEAVIRLENVSVRYQVPEERINTFKEYAIRRLQRKVIFRDFWSLRNINLEIHKGEIFGIIGKNGAGKSTLLKVVARVLAPTKGRLCIKGRVSPLLELGAGFHSELTGLENIFLNGTVLGHSRSEIESKLDEIIDFAEIGSFIDAPLRTYSSGMVARLGFSVATAWKPEILILDEILSVGDEAFRRKCLERMHGFQLHGVTTLFVSHDMKSISQMCGRAILLERGVPRLLGNPDSVIMEYQAISSI